MAISSFPRQLTEFAVFCTWRIVRAELLVPEVSIVAVDIIVLDVEPAPVAVQRHFRLNWEGGDERPRFDLFGGKYKQPVQSIKISSVGRRKMVSKGCPPRAPNYFCGVHTIFAASPARAFLDLHWKVFILLLTAWMLSKGQANNKEEMPERHLGELWLLKRDTLLHLFKLFLSRAHFGVHTFQSFKYMKTDFSSVVNILLQHSVTLISQIYENWFRLDGFHLFAIMFRFLFIGLFHYYIYKMKTSSVVNILLQHSDTRISQICTHIKSHCLVCRQNIWPILNNQSETMNTSQEYKVSLWPFSFRDTLQNKKRILWEKFPNGGAGVWPYSTPLFSLYSPIQGAKNDKQNL